MVFPFSRKHNLVVKVLKILETPTPLLNRPLYFFTLVSEGSDPIWEVEYRGTKGGVRMGKSTSSSWRVLRCSLNPRLRGLRFNKGVRDLSRRPAESHPGMLRVAVVSSPLQERHLQPSDRRIGLPESTREEKRIVGERKTGGGELDNGV